MPSPKQKPPLVIGIYGAGPTGKGYSNEYVKEVADAVGGTMYNGPGNVPKALLWVMPIFKAIDAHYIDGSNTAGNSEKIIIFGYSMGGRGAVVIAEMMALQSKYRHITVALAGIDPVQLVDQDPMVLPDNVSSWVNYYQQDETNQGIIDFKARFPFVNVDFARISGGPFSKGKLTGAGLNHKLTTESERKRVNHVTLPQLVKGRIIQFIRAHQLPGASAEVSMIPRSKAGSLSRSSSATQSSVLDSAPPAHQD